MESNVKLPIIHDDNTYNNIIVVISNPAICAKYAKIVIINNVLIEIELSRVENRKNFDIDILHCLDFACSNCYLE